MLSPLAGPFGRCLLFLSLLACLAAAARSQSLTTRATDGKTPSEIAPGSPAGSYPLGDFDNVNLFSRGLGFRLPLVGVGGRGSAGYTITLPIERKWRVDLEASNPGAGCAGCEIFFTEHRYRPNPGWHTSLKPGFGAGVMLVRPAGMGLHSSAACGQSYRSTLTRLTFVTPDGTEYEFRDKLHGGAPRPATAICGVRANRGREFVTADGSAATFVADADVIDREHPLPDPESSVITVSGHLFLRDGTRYRIHGNRVEWMRDRNGNLVRFLYSVADSSQPGGYVDKVIDPLGREVVINNTTNEVTYRGFGDAARTVRVVYGWLSGRLRPANAEHGAETQKTYGELFPTIAAGGQADDGLMNSLFDDRVVSEVVLPDTRKYEFFYNSYGELARVVLPTGGAFEYDYEPGDGVINMGVTDREGSGLRYEIFRRVTRRRVYDAGGRLEGVTTFGDCAAAPGGSCVQVDQLDPHPDAGNSCAQPPDGTGYRLVSRTKHHYRGVPGPGLFTEPTHYSRWDEGREFKTEAFACDGTTLLRAAEQKWRQREQVGWWVNYNQFERGPEPANDPRMVESLTTLADTNQVSKQTAIDPADPAGQTVGFDRYNNPTDLWEYDFGAPGTGLPGAFLRRTHTDYETAAAYVDLNPDSPTQGAHLRGLPLRRWVSADIAGAARASLTEYEYDSYAPDSQQRHAALLPRAGITGLCLKLDGLGACAQPSDASFTRRGNVTGVTSYADAAGQAGAVTASSQYDVAGNVVNAVDARGYASTVEYEDRFGLPDAEARENRAPAGLQGLSTFAFPTKVTNALGHAAYTQYDYSSGLVVNTEDANGTVGSVRYDDDLDRPTQAVRAENVPALRSQTTIAYDDAGRKVTTTSDQSAFGDNLLKGEARYDGLGRTVEARQYEGGGQYVATLTRYDALSRAAEVSNPHRPLASPAESPIWTKTRYDALGRAVEVETPDGAKARTFYDGARLLVADQAGKRRLSVTDALGRLTEVWEVRGADAASGTEAVSFPVPQGAAAVTAGYRTVYKYDALGNLRKVGQGGQQRHFMYDSLGRLIRAKNPEQGNFTADPDFFPALTDTTLGQQGNNVWSVGYLYDENGNLWKRKDARNVTTTYGYDELNRVTSRSYSDATPAVAYFNDSQWPTAAGAPAAADFDRGLSKGRLVAVTYGGGSEGTYYGGYDALGGVTHSLQRTGGENYPFPSYAYDLAGNLTSQTYPSRRVVKSEYDAAGRLAGVRNGAAGPFYAGGLATDPASRIRYTAHGAVSAMRLAGNDQLWEHTSFNSRLQVREIGLGTAPTDSSILKLEYSYGVVTNGALDSSKNNGNVQGQAITQPGLTLRQTYEYDELNRLKSAREQGGQVETWTQSYSYDRFGNRTFGAGTSVPALAQGQEDALWNPSVSDANNRITSAGYVYDDAGNLTVRPDARGRFTHAYDAESRMVEADNTSQPNAKSVYAYDGDGRRVKKVTGMSGSTGGATTVFVYDAFGKLVAEYANTPPAKNGTQYLTADQLGSPRVVTGAAGNVEARHDFLPFGEEIGAGVGGRTTQQGYSVADNIRQKFTGQERDIETGLDYFRARYYASAQGRFTGVDPLLASGRIEAPQTWNRYAYALNNPLRFIDPTGLFEWDTSLGGSAADKDVSKKIREKREQIRAAIKKANEALNSGKLSSTQKANLERALNAYGAEGTKNGVNLAMGKVSDGAAAETTSPQPYILYNQQTGNLSANVTVTFKEGGTVDAGTFAHEGSHIADRQELVAAFDKASASDPLADWLYMPENITVRQTESRAYRVSAAVAQGLGTSFSPGGYEVWNSGWREADRSTNMQKGIKEVLTKSSLYKDRLNDRLIREKK